MTIDKRTWHTYATRAYTYDVANDQRSAGGVHLHQVRWHPEGGWQKRILQANGRYEAAGAVTPIDGREGCALFATAEQEAAQ